MQKMCAFGFYFYFHDMWGMSDEWTHVYELNEWSEKIRSYIAGLNLDDSPLRKKKKSGHDKL
jgi:hypothetical protein